MKNKFALISVLVFIGCGTNDSIDKHNEYFSITKTDLSNLDSLNQILFRNKDKINAEDFEASLKGHDSLQYKKSYHDFESVPINNQNDKFELFTTDLNTTDSVVVYQIKMETYSETKIYHSLVFRADPNLKRNEYDQKIVKSKKLNIYWTYNIIND